jgi:transforming growth factor-beta-induced protein
VVLTPTAVPSGGVIPVEPTTIAPGAVPTTVSPSLPVTDSAGVTAAQILTTTAPATTTATLTTNAAPTAPDPLANMGGQTIGQIIQGVGDFSVLASALNQAGMMAVLSDPGPFTLFAPTDEAFAVLPDAIRESLLNDQALLTSLLQYHLVADLAGSARLAELGGAQSVSSQLLTVTIATTGELLVNDATIVRGDVPAANGVIHVINRILTPPGLPLSIPPAPTATIGLANDTAVAQTLADLAAADTSGQTILEILRSTKGLGVAAAAIDSAGLTEALEQPGPFTLFVPTDAALNAVPTLADLLNNTAASTELIQYHLVLDTVTSADLARLPVVLAANGQAIDVTVGADGAISLNNALVLQADIEVANGVIHIIGAVLTPPAQ